MNKENNSHKQFLPLVSLGIFCIALLVWRMDSPLPYYLGWDMYAHYALFQEIVAGNVHVLPSYISDTFLLNAYTPMYSMLIGTGKAILFAMPLVTYFNLLDTVHLFFAILLAVYMAWIVSKNEWIAVISGIMSGFTYESLLAQTAFFSVPQTTAALLIVLAFTLWFVDRRGLAVSIIVATFLLHYVIGAFGWGLLLVLWIVEEIEKRKLFQQYGKNLWIFVGLVALGTALGESRILEINPLQTAESIIFTFSVGEKWNYLLQWYSLTVIFYLIGIVAILFEEGRIVKLVAFFSLVCLTVVFLPIPYSFKLYTVGRFFVHIVVAYGVWQLLNVINSSYIRATLLVLLASVVVTNFYLNQRVFKQAIAYGAATSTVSPSETEAAEFLKTQYGERDDVILVSEPATQHVLEGLSGVNTQGGAFTTTETRRALQAVYPFPGYATIKNNLYSIEDSVITEPANTVLFAVSGRFISWQHLNDSQQLDVGYNIWGPRSLTLEGLEYIRLLDNDSDFRRVFQNEDIVIFELQRR